MPEKIVHALRACHKRGKWRAPVRGSTAVEQFFDKPVDLARDALLDQGLARPLAGVLEFLAFDQLDQLCRILGGPSGVGKGAMELIFRIAPKIGRLNMTLSNCSVPRKQEASASSFNRLHMDPGI
jgi:hypothetical protein